MRYFAAFMLIATCCRTASGIDWARMDESEDVKHAVSRLNDTDKELFKKQKPLGVLLARFDVSGFSPVEGNGTLVALERSKLKGSEGWRIVLLGSNTILAFHVSDERKETLLLRKRLDDHRVKRPKTAK